jgi:prepilin-type N-terminal cleavage/methylation domain-containing protein
MTPPMVGTVSPSRPDRVRRLGFTLIEVLIVVVILGVLAAIVVPRFADARRDASVSAVRNQLQTLRGQVELLRIEQRATLGELMADYPTHEELFDALKARGLIRSHPQWPAPFEIDTAHYEQYGELRLTLGPVDGGHEIDVDMVEAW